MKNQEKKRRISDKARCSIELAVILILLAGLIFANQKLAQYVASDKVEDRHRIIVLDPGHGGSDPGKISVNGVLEKDLNLAIARKTEELLKAEGYDVIMTRKDDEVDQEQKGKKSKRQEMQMRVEQINEAKPILAVSIHQNSYHTPDIRGAQVFYYTGSREGERAAEQLQEAFLKVDEMNHRKAKENNTYYLLRRTQVPTVIVECGFLSNPEEALLLESEEYQEKVAEVILHGIQAYVEN